MPAVASEEMTALTLPRLGATVAVAALLCPALTLPLTLACLIALGSAAREEARRHAEPVPEMGPLQTDDDGTSTEDSFPASDPPSFTVVTGTGTRH